MRRVVRVAAAAGYLAVGSLALALSVDSFHPEIDVLVQVLGTVLPAILAAKLVVVTSWLAFWSDLSDRGFQRVVVWSGAGMLALGSFALLLVGVGDGRFMVQRPAFLVLNSAVSGALAGIGVGMYDVLSRRQGDQIRAEREKLDVLNRMLRHHLLNGMNVVLASAEELERKGTDEPELEIIRERSHEVVALVEQVSEITDEIHREPGAELVALRSVLREAIDRSRAVYGVGTIRLEEPVPETPIRCDGRLVDALEAVLCQRATLNDEVAVSAVEEGDTAIVRVVGHATARAATATSLADGGRERYGPAAQGQFHDGDGHRYAATVDQGVDLYMAELLLSQSGGELHAFDGPDGPLIELHIPLD